MQISAASPWLLTGDCTPQPETPFRWRLPAHRLWFLQKMPPRWSSPSARRCWGAIMGTCWKKRLCFPHVGLCYFFHPPSQEAAEISGKRPLSVFSEAKRVVPLYFRKGKFCLVQPNHYLENNCKESSPLLFMPKEAAWAAFWMLPLLFARGQKSHIDNGLCSRGATHLLKLWV